MESWGFGATPSPCHLVKCRGSLGRDRAQSLSVLLTLDTKGKLTEEDATGQREIC